MENIAAFVERCASLHPYQPALLLPQHSFASKRNAYEIYTYQALHEEILKTIKALTEFGISKGMRVVLFVKPGFEFFSLTFALMRMGAVPVFIDPGIGFKHLKACIKNAKPEAFIGIPKAHILRVLLGLTKSTIPLQGSMGRSGFAKNLRPLIQKASKATPNSGSKDDEAAILFTSGSTGVPKGALYRHRHFIAQVEALKGLYEIRPGEVDLCTFPLFALFAPALGMSAVIAPMNFQKPGKAAPKPLLRIIKELGVTNLFGSPALLKQLEKGLKTSPPGALTSLKRIISAGAPVPINTIASLVAHLPGDGDIHTPYGATEALPIASVSGRELLKEASLARSQGQGVLVGQPVPGIRVRIVGIFDDKKSYSELTPLPQGQVGEIMVAGAQVTESYVHHPQGNELHKVFDPEGTLWHRMGDLGRLDDKGALWFYGRKAHRVRTPDGDIYSVAYEGIFQPVEGVERVALVGVGEPGGQKPVLYIEPKRWRKGEKERLRQTLLTHAKSQPMTEGLDTVLFCKKFPVDIRHNSKIFREALREQATKELF